MYDADCTQEAPALAACNATDAATGVTLVLIDTLKERAMGAWRVGMWRGLVGRDRSFVKRVPPCSLSRSGGAFPR